MEKIHKITYNKTKHNYDCMVCGSELKYFEDFKKVECLYCHGNFKSNVTCESGHYICDLCHSMDANQAIENYCKSTDKTNPMEMAIELMKIPVINMHGPEHHFLVPAVLLASYYNIKGEKNFKDKKLSIAKTRAKDIKGGFCGFYGNCGAAVGTGMYISIVTETTPLSKENWGLVNIMTGTSLISIGNIGGPRCCKRNLFVAIEEAAKFTEKNFDLKMYDYEKFTPKCSFKSKNKQCLQLECPYYA
ncbi:MAG: SAM-dependent methyltransferase [Tissierella sp.]|nr:SAM-dependent methyltransferase [Tissierella sp.]